MSNYSPDKWVIAVFNRGTDKEVSKVMGGWSGGYLDGDSWRISSGIKEVEKDGDYYNIINHSGSVYRCHKEMNDMTPYMAQVYGDFKKKLEDDGNTVELITVEEFLES